eukprot:TRINITY_DN9298_c1_g1_i1.p1 TRINITY_DN9298_c1_g1~~TRINITY_DN9298_c1_g1_i1.p1  ORF type:complete len:312 (-),score=33.73 TRINITY_DN9298_c1_g1_i1:423-1358(-)
MSSTKAAVPRPTLIAQDLDHCHRLYHKLESRSLIISQSDNNAWEALVPNCRQIRSFLLRERIFTDFTVRAYELSLDVSVRAEEWDDVFSTLITLIKTIYPALSEQKRTRDSNSSTGLSQQFYDMKMEDSDLSDVEMDSEGLAIFHRYEEIESLLILYYLGIPRQIDFMELNICLNRVQKIIDDQIIQWTVKVMKIVLRNDFVNYFRVLNEGTINQQQILKLRSNQMQILAVNSMSKSYRRIGLKYVLSVLQLEQLEQVKGILNQLSKRGNECAKNALANLELQITQNMLSGLVLSSQANSSDQEYTLVFKQ